MTSGPESQHFCSPPQRARTRHQPRQAGGFVVDAGHVFCLPAVLGFTTQTNGGVGWTISATSTAPLHLNNAVTMAIGGPNACQDADFGVYLVATP